ncbi:MAG: DUF5519 family protein [Pleurocapsa minor GSE-CHR-MK-17-07R]|jgi:hypothetical protein|nr:DUF5519 family protein [Pleurocapsa minor GSE-CHR-MK 17-07R]
MMREWVNQVIETVSGWDGISAAPHRFGGVEFSLGNVEVGHVHLNNGMVDIPYTVKLREALVASGAAGLHHLLRDSGWITFYIRTAEDAAHAARLYRLSYLQKRARRDKSLTPESYAAQIDALGFAPPVRAAMPAPREVASTPDA